MSNAPEPGDAPAPEPAPAPAAGSEQARRRRFFPRFTLRTLTLCVLLAASGTAWWFADVRWTARWAKENQELIVRESPFSSDGSGILSAENGRLTVLNAKDGHERFGIERENPGNNREGFSADGRFVYSWNHGNQTVRMWNAADGSESEKVELNREAGVVDIAGSWIYLTEDVRESGQLLYAVQAMEISSGRIEHEINVEHVCFDRRFTQMACVLPDNHIEIYRLPAFERTARFPEPEAKSFIFALFPETGKVMVRTVQGERLHILDAESGKPLTALDIAGRSNLRYELPEDGALAIAQSFDQARENIYDTSKNEVLWSTDDSPDRYFVFSWSAHGEYLAVREFEVSLLDKNWVYIVQGRTGKRVFDLISDERSLEGVWFSPAELAVLVLDRDGTLTMWERRRPEQWWGVAWLPEFWLTAVFALLTLWSLARDFKTLRTLQRDQVKQTKAAA